MPFYLRQGKIPQKRHTAFYKEDGSLYREELFSTHGFSNIYSNKYHHDMPTKTLYVERVNINHGQVWQDDLIQNYKINTAQNDSVQGNHYTARKALLSNPDCAIYSAKVTENSSQFYRNAYADELIFIHQGSGELLSEYGRIEVKQWDYLVIPRGTIYQLNFDDFKNTRLFILESFSMLEIQSLFNMHKGKPLINA